MKKFIAKWVLLAALVLPQIVNAQTFNYQFGDVLAGFRKTGQNAGLYELVVDLGNVTNFLKLPAGTTINITNYTATEITNAFADVGGYQNLQWSVFSAFPNSSAWVTPLGTFPADTLRFTLPSTSVSTQTQAPALGHKGLQQNVDTEITGAGGGAASIAALLTGAPNTNNNPHLIREPVTYYSSGYTLSFFIGDSQSVAEGDFGAGGSPLPFVVENTTPNPFTAAQRSDFYESVPSGAKDPITGVTNANAYYVGYFILNPNGTETFTRAAAATAPAITSVTSTATNGFAPLQVVFTNTATGTITSWVWNFGNGTIITNTTGAAVTNTYTTGGNYTVTLTVSGPAGSSTNVLASFIVASAAPQLASAVLANGKFVVSGASAPAGIKYRILTATNLTAGWTPVFTNTFPSNGSFSYTNSAPTNSTAFFRLVSP